MKKVFALSGAILMLTPLLGIATTLTVQTDQAQMRSEPNFFSKIITNVRYSSAVDLVEERGAWRLVKYKQKQGWMHLSALVKPAVKLSIGKAVSGDVSGREVSLAGKGMKELEKAFKEKHPSLNFTAVDKMEQMTVTASELEKFAAESDFSTTAR